MLSVESNFIPIFNSKAGLCLTSKNWQELNIRTISYSLEDLLYKPGKDMLSNIADLAQYTGWVGGVVVNAMSMNANKDGSYKLKSPYDGSLISITFSEIITLLNGLKPNMVLFPKKSASKFLLIEKSWNDSMMPFFHADDLQEQHITRSHGVYFDFYNSPKLELSLNWEQLNRWSYRARYVMGNLSQDIIKSLIDNKIEFIETDEPTQSAMNGLVYQKNGVVDLRSLETQMQFSMIEDECICPTCSQKLTRAYLYHLLQHTPMLCQRFLIQHNLFHVQKYFG